MTDGNAGGAPASPEAGLGAGTAQETQGGQEQQATQAPAATPQAPVLPLDEFGNYLVEVQVNGETQFVPLSEARAAHMRQADYTQKTQALAAEREQLALAARLQAALESDPEATLNALAEAYGLSAQEAQQAVEQGEELDPDAAFRQQVEAFMEEQRQQQVLAEVESQLASMKQQYGEFDEAALLQIAVDKGIPDLSVAYAYMTFAQQQGQPQAPAPAPQPNLQQQAAQRLANLPPVAPGHGAAQGAVVPGGADKVESVDDAFAQALRSHGLTSL